MRIFLSKREPCASPSLLVGIGLRTTHIIWGKHQVKGWVYSARLSLSRSLSPLYPFHLSPFHLYIPFTSLSLSPLYSFTSLSFSPLYPFHLSIPFTSLSYYLSLPLYIFPSTFLSLSLLLSIILFGVSNGRFRPCYKEKS